MSDPPLKVNSILGPTDQLAMPSIESKLTHMNDVLGNLFCVLQKFETENVQLKRLVSLLLHFKHMLKFAVKNNEFKTNSIATDEPQQQQVDSGIVLIQDNVSNFMSDYKECLSKFISFTDGMQFVAEKESLYQQGNNNDEKYCPLKDFPSADEDAFASTSNGSTYFSNVSNHLQTKQITPMEFPNLVDSSNNNLVANKKNGTNSAIENVEAIISEEDDVDVDYRSRRNYSNFDEFSDQDVGLDSDLTQTEDELVVEKAQKKSPHGKQFTKKSKILNSYKREMSNSNSSRSKSTRKASSPYSSFDQSSSTSSGTRRSARITNRSIEAAKAVANAAKEARKRANTKETPKQTEKKASTIDETYPCDDEDERPSTFSTAKKPNQKFNFLSSTPLYKFSSKKITSTVTTEIVPISTSGNFNNDCSGGATSALTTSFEPIVIDHSKFAQLDVSLFYEVRRNGEEKSFLCKIPECDYYNCSKQFTISHVLKHFNLKPIGCSHCDYRTDMRKYMIRHTMRYHKISAELFPFLDYFVVVPNQADGSNSFVCKFGGNLCQFEAKHTTPLMGHVTYHLSQSPFKCAFCEERFSDLALVRRHLGRNHKRRRHHAKGLACPYVNCTFLLDVANLENMLTHIKDHHQFIPKVKFANAPSSLPFASTSKRMLGEGSQPSLRTNPAKKRRFSQETDDAVNEITDENQGAFQQPKYSCSYKNCRYKSHSWTQVKAHEYRRHMKLEFRCTQNDCNVGQFENKEELNQHLMDVHEISQFRCGIVGCNRAFINSSRLKNHMKESHSDAYLTCSKCQKVFKSRLNMMKHYRIQHIEGEFACPEKDCDFVGQFRVELVRHKSTAHTKMKKCPVEECGQMVHCGVFQSHMNRHYNIKNHVCSWPECGKAFVDRKSLKDHIRIHLNFKRFKCKWPDCGYAAEQRSNVIKHIRIKHFKLPYTLKEQLELNISTTQRPQDYLEVLPDDIAI